MPDSPLYPVFTPTGFLFDVDNTLTNAERVVTSRTAAALQELQQTSVLTSMCTGRGWCVLETDFARYFRPSDLHVTMGGSQIVRNDGQIVWEHLLEHDQVKSICNQVAAVGAEFSFIVPEGYVATPDIYDYYGKAVKRHVPLIRPEEQKRWATGSIVVGWETPELREVLANIKGISYRRMWHSSQSMFYEITAEGVNKATGAQHWAELTGTSLETTVGFGDNGNDIEFLQAVGFSVAMGNATKEVLAISDTVVGDCDNDGLAEWLESFCSR